MRGGTGLAEWECADRIPNANLCAYATGGTQLCGDVPQTHPSCTNVELHVCQCGTEYHLFFNEAACITLLHNCGILIPVAVRHSYVFLSGILPGTSRVLSPRCRFVCPLGIHQFGVTKACHGNPIFFPREVSQQLHACRMNAKIWHLLLNIRLTLFGIVLPLFKCLLYSSAWATLHMPLGTPCLLNFHYCACHGVPVGW